MAKHIPCTIEEYHERPEWSRSQLEVAHPKKRGGKGSWSLFYGKFVAKPPLYPPEQSDALDDGTIAHTALLEPHRLGDVVRVIPREALNADGHRKGSAWKAFEAANGGITLRKEEEMSAVRQMIANVHADEAAEALLCRAKEREFTILYEHKETGLPLRARLDLLCQCGDQWLIADFKTSRAVDEEDFDDHIAHYGYHRQAAWYWDAAEALGLDVSAFVLVVVNKSPAHECFVQELDTNDIELGREENNAILRELKRRLEANDWRRPGAGRIGKGHLPKWYWRLTSNE